MLQMARMSRANSDRELRQLFDGLAEDQSPADLRERLHADVEERFPETQPTLAGRSLCSRPMLAGAAVVALVCVVVGLLLNTRSTDVLAATLEAMAQVKTAHRVWLHGESWYSADHGLRSEWDGRIEIYTTEGTWDYRVDENRLIIREPDADATSIFLQRICADLEALRNTPAPEGLSYRVSDVLLDGAPAKRLDVKYEEGQAEATAWIDDRSMRLLKLEEWELKDGRRVLHDRARIEYDMPIDAALFTFEPPPGATIIDCRFDPELRELVQAAREAAKTLPIHSIGRERDDGDWDEWEAWKQDGVGFREEHADAEVWVGNTRQVCYYSQPRRHVVIYDSRRWMWPDGRWKFRPKVREWFFYLRGKRQSLSAAKPEVTREERKGRPFLRVVLYGGRAEREKRVYVFDLTAKRLAEYAEYGLDAGEWHLTEQAQLDYPEQLPRGIFDFQPPPGWAIDDTRER